VLARPVLDRPVLVRRRPVLARPVLDRPVLVRRRRADSVEVLTAVASSPPARLRRLRLGLRPRLLSFHSD
jgi:hypothetical protein